MYISKNSKAFHKKLSMIFSVFKQTDGEEIIFIDDGILYFASYYIAGSIDIKNLENTANEDLISGFYQLKQLPRKDFILDVLPENKIDDYIRGTKIKVMKILKEKRYISHVEDTGHKVSDTINLTGLVLKDSHCKMITKMKDFDVNISGCNLVTEYIEEFENENLFVTTNLLFMGYGNEDDK